MSRFLLLLVISFFILLYFCLQCLHIARVFWFITVGLFIGLYYGWFNNNIFHRSERFNNEFEKVHALWIHIVCGLASSASLFVISNRFPFVSPGFGVGDFALLIFGILGISGLLPRALWFFANKGELKP